MGSKWAKLVALIQLDQNLYHNLSRQVCPKGLGGGAASKADAWLARQRQRRCPHGGANLNTRRRTNFKGASCRAAVEGMTLKMVNFREEQKVASFVRYAH